MSMNPRKLIKRLNGGDLLTLEEYQRIDEYRQNERIRQRQIRARTRQKKTTTIKSSLYVFPFQQQHDPELYSPETTQSPTLPVPTLTQIRHSKAVTLDEDKERTLRLLALDYILNKDTSTSSCCFEQVTRGQPWNLTSLLS
ncbi:hypothetical protein LIPSTDRAFT_74486 [Lipomyces starkeyi NRRL Y-11557]|uniref:Uncharacterized protein n=1 Tax=Lipomyces starkeyi NRRL Y-11557 TaxID=675824 RepID=A0A1E3Q012_LIPST|nr:hypothetical protein LIPSTDRAFT_74486 [Lipomyces starkeyi NRRL Y-11557]